jgi:hypothetical protein
VFFIPHNNIEGMLLQIKLISGFQKGEIVMSKIAWITSLNEGLKKAEVENKLVFLDFFNPN